jgi:hypothetical protein
MSELRSHQQDALNRLESGKILWGGVGSGKSRVAAAYYMKVWADANVYVITTAKKRDSLDWQREFASWGVGTQENASLAGTLTVDSWNNIQKYQNVSNAFFIFDEQRLVGRGGWVKNFLKIAQNKTNGWILLSATPGDSWMDYIPVFIANGFYRNRTEFLREHVIFKSYTKFPAVDRYASTGTLIKHRNDIVVHMPYEKHTKRMPIAIPIEYDAELMDVVVKKRWNPWKSQPCRSSAEVYMLARKVVATHPSRFEALIRKMESCPKLIVYYNFDYELDILRTIQTRPVAEWNGHKHEEIPKSDTWLYLVQYTAGAEAWECIETNTMFFYSQNPSYKLTEQCYGRIDRLNTPFAKLFYYVPLSKAPIDIGLRAAFVGKRDFNMADYLTMERVCLDF